MKVLKPKKLKTGDTIGIVAQSLPVLSSHQENYLKGITVLKNLGFKVREGRTTKTIRWWSAGGAKEVAEEINDMFKDPEVKAIMAHTGGYSAISVLDHLDYGMIANNPKPYMGLSDMSSIHLALFEKSGLVGFHMDDLTFGKSRGLKEEIDLFKKFLMTKDAPGVVSPLTEWENWKNGKAKGHLLGGNLHIIMAQSATSYFPSKNKWEGAILFFEEVGETLYDIARCLYELKYMGILDKISGMLVGKIKYVKPIKEAEIIEPTYKDLILNILRDFNFPIMGEVDVGHFTVNIPMPLGIKIEMDADKKTLRFLESAVA